MFNWLADKESTKHDETSPSEKTSDGSEIVSSTTSTATSDENKETSSIKTKVYKFQENWKTNRSWLIFDNELNVMYCNVCKQYDKLQKANSFREGTSSFRKQNVEAHEHSRRVIESKRVMEKPANERPMEKLTTLMSQMEIEQMKILFRTAFYVAKKASPFSDFPDLLKLQRVHGVKIGESYCNDKQARTFISFIYEEQRHNIAVEINETDFFAVLADGSTDSSVVQEEIVYVKYLHDYYPETVFVVNKPLEKADAESITAAVVSAMKDELEVPEWQDKLVGCALDGASVNLGRLSGVAVRLKSDNAEHLIIIHCFAHRLELAIKDVVKQNSYMATVDDFFEKIFKFYKNSALNWSGLKISGAALGVPVFKLVNVVGCRWLPHHERAVEVVLKMWVALVTHLQQVCISGTRVSKEMAKSFLKTLKSPKFVMYLNFFSAYLKLLSALSKVFQGNHHTIETVVAKIEAVKSKFEQLSDKAKLEQVISKDLAVNESGIYMFRGIPLTIEGHTRETRSDGAALAANALKVQKELSGIVDQTLQNIVERFGNTLEDPVVAALRMFDPQNWPQDTTSLETYGDDNIPLLYSHFNAVLEKKGYNVSEAELEWIDLKQHVNRLQAVNQPPLPFLKLWQSVLRQDSVTGRFRNILALVQIALVIPINSAECERGFSLMGRVKCDWRNRLKPNTLTELMSINLCNTGYEDYDPEKAILMWLRSGKLPKRFTKPYGPRSKQEEAAWDTDEEEN